MLTIYTVSHCVYKTCCYAAPKISLPNIILKDFYLQHVINAFNKKDFLISYERHDRLCVLYQVTKAAVH
jgi:hypothetical protein